VVLVVIPCVTIDKNNHWATHSPTTLWLVGVGIGLLAIASGSFAYNLLWGSSATAGNLSAGLDLSRVEEAEGVLSTTVAGCTIRVVEGRLEDYPAEPGAAVVLPCNEYFDDRCVADTKSALGAFVNKHFEGRVDAFVSLMKSESAKRLGPGAERQKTDDERATSFGPGKCLLLLTPLGRSTPVALMSTTTQRAGQGLVGRLSYLFTGLRELVTRLADARINEVVMPVLAAGHGGIDPPLAFVGLLLAVAEAARYRDGGQLRRVTIVVFKPNSKSPAEVDPVVVRRGLALISSEG
jgi:hypothetical protein